MEQVIKWFPDEKHFMRWMHRITNVLCSDGKYRSCELKQEPDTFFSIPAKTKVKGKTVTGFVTHDGDGIWKFYADKWRKNYHLLKEKEDKYEKTLALLEATECFFDRSIGDFPPHILELRKKLRKHFTRVDIFPFDCKKNIEMTVKWIYIIEKKYGVERTW